MTPLIQTILFRVGGLPKESIDSSKVSFWLFGWDKMTPRVKMTPCRGQNDFIEKELKWLLWFKTTLFRVGGLPKELVDSSKVSFWLLGGVEMTPKVKMTPWRSQNDFLLKESKWLYGVKTTPFILQCKYYSWRWWFGLACLVWFGTTMFALGEPAVRINWTATYWCPLNCSCTQSIYINLHE